MATAPCRNTEVHAISRLTHERPFCYGDPASDNLIVHGDNLDALSALESVYAGAVRCIYIDPPYNNREKYTHYSDDLDHTAWLREIKERLAHLREFLSDDGSLWISIDDNELHYLKVAADAIFGRSSFAATIVWEQRTSRENRRAFSYNHEYVLVYAKNLRHFKAARNLLALTPDVFKRYSNPDNDPRGAWQSVSLNVQAGHATPQQFYELVAPNGRVHLPPKGRCWIYNIEAMRQAIDEGLVWFGADGNRVPRLKHFLATAKAGLTPETLWRAVDVGTTRIAKHELHRLFPNEAIFDTPKPERLLERILHIATDPGDIVLDAYLGSGTTAAVAHKMDRRYVGIEVGAHAATHAAARLRRVVDGESGGISATVPWDGGGGFHFMRIDH